jgi:membrane peptidoglycan carboxypeptidase
VSTILADPHFGKTYDDRYANLQSAGWKIYTTLNLGLEKSAKQTLSTYVPSSSPVFNVGGTVISLEVGTGRIITMTQNKTYANTQSATKTAVNYNTDQAYGGSGGFQPGSTFKLFTLLQWLKTGHRLDDVVDGNPRTVLPSQLTECGKPYQGIPWTVGNDTKEEGGNQTVLRSTAMSINGSFASMASQLDLCDIRNLAEKFGVRPATGGDLSDFAPFVIGGASAVSPLSMANAYATIANEGSLCRPIAIDRVVQTDGSDLSVPKPDCKQVISKSVAIAAAYALHTVFDAGYQGTASGDDTPDGLYEFGKTGTTDNAVQTWMIGSTSKVTTAVWVGNVSGGQNLRETNFGYCPAGYLPQAAAQRHCVWKGVQTAINKVYGGATSWPAPDPQYVSGGAGSSPTTSPTTSNGTVPNVVGMSVTAAENALVAAGYAWAINGSSGGTVASQSPAAGSAAPQHTEVTITPGG